MVAAAPRAQGVFNAADKDASVALSNADRTMAVTTAVAAGVRGLNSRTTGKNYCEFLVDVLSGGSDAWIGFTSGSNRNPGTGGPGGAFRSFNGAVYGGGSLLASGFSYAAGDRLGFAFDVAANKFWVSKNGVWLYGDPAAGTAGLGYGSTGVAMYPAAYGNVNNVQVSIPALTFYPPPASFVPI